MSDVNLEELLSKARVASEEESAEYFDAQDFRWSETVQGDDSPEGTPVIYINDQKFRNAGAKDYRHKMALGESIHLLKNEKPEYYNSLIEAALSDPEMSSWLKNSYKREVNNGEKREFDHWLRQSRFDQVIGGYLFGGDESIPTMRGWSRDSMPFGGLRPEFEKIREFNFGEDFSDPSEVGVPYQ